MGKYIAADVREGLTTSRVDKRTCERACRRVDGRSKWRRSKGANGPNRLPILQLIYSPFFSEKNDETRVLQASDKMTQVCARGGGQSLWPPIDGCSFVRSPFAVHQQNVQVFFSQITGPKLEKLKHQCTCFFEHRLEIKIGFVAI